jgi:uncharacterized zinc-type alcohol dehydrogenase-like protein
MDYGGSVNVTAMIADAKSSQLSQGRIDLGPLGTDSVVIEVSHCGLCGGDLRLLTNKDHARLIPGHEVVGKIVEVGQSISQNRIGELVGVGWQSAACRSCHWCLRGEPELCVNQEETCIGRAGGFATHIKVQSEFAIPIPDGLDPIHAAPLLCGGLAVFTPLINYKIGQGHRVGVVGIGGLGHLALQFLKALGAEPIAFSHSPNKESDAFALGASMFVNLNDGERSRELHSSCDFIICTSSGPIDWKEMLKVLRPGGIICVVGVSNSEIQLSAKDLIDERKTLTGNPIGSPATLRSLFDFVLENKIRPWTTNYSMSEANNGVLPVALRDV